MTKASQILWAKLYAIGGCTKDKMLEHVRPSPAALAKLDMLSRKAEVRKNVRIQLQNLLMKNGLAKKMLRVL